MPDSSVNFLIAHDLGGREHALLLFGVYAGEILKFVAENFCGDVFQTPYR